MWALRRHAFDQYGRVTSLGLKRRAPTLEPSKGRRPDNRLKGADPKTAPQTKGTDPRICNPRAACCVSRFLPFPAWSCRFCCRRLFRLCGCPPPVCVCVRVRVCALFPGSVWPFGLVLCFLFCLLLPERRPKDRSLGRYTLTPGVLTIVTLRPWYLLVVGWLLILLVLFLFRSLLSFPPSRSLLPSDSKKEVPWRESHCVVLLRRDEAGGPCSGVRTDDLWLTSPGVFAQEHAVDLGFKCFVCYLLSSLICRVPSRTKCWYSLIS